MTTRDLIIAREADRSKLIVLSSLFVLLMFGAGFILGVGVSPPGDTSADAATASSLEEPEAVVSDAEPLGATASDSRIAGTPDDVDEDPVVVESDLAMDPEPLPGRLEVLPRFGVRVGVFAVSENAARSVEVLRAEGFRPEVVTVRGDRGAVLQYVYAATFDDVVAARAAAARVPGDTYVERLPHSNPSGQ